MMMIRRAITLMVLATLLAIQPGAAAQDEPRRRAQVEAATASAVERLQSDIGAMAIAGDVTVNNFLDRTAGSQELRRVLQRSQQIGGPRWIDEQTCQVQLEASGEAVAQTLINIAAANPQRSPIPPQALERELRGWKGRKFLATGTSATSERVQKFRPGGPWTDVPEDSRCQALDSARQDAIRRSLESVRSIEIAPGQTVGDALSRPQIAQRMNQWFEARPVKAVSYNDDLAVDLLLSAPAHEVFDAFVESAQAERIELPSDEAELAQLRAQFVQRMNNPAGRGKATAPSVETIQRRPVDLPAQAPAWVAQQFDADGESGPGRNPLLANHAAQEQAIKNLRAKIGALPLTEGQTLDQASNADARLGEAIDRAMVRARVFKVDYGPDGSVRVRVGLDARTVWDEILNAR